MPYQACNEAPNSNSFILIPGWQWEKRSFCVQQYHNVWWHYHALKGDINNDINNGKSYRHKQWQAHKYFDQTWVILSKSETQRRNNSNSFIILNAWFLPLNMYMTLLHLCIHCHLHSWYHHPVNKSDSIDFNNKVHNSKLEVAICHQLQALNLKKY